MLLWAGGLAPAFPANSIEGTQVSKQPAKLETKYYDPENPPNPPPPIPPGLKAVTHFDFICSAYCEVDNLDEGVPDPAGGGIKANVRVKNLCITLSLPITVWLPRKPSALLRSHEEGHVALTAKVYEAAEPIANIASESVVGKVFQGTAATVEEARKQAIINAIHAFCQPYHAMTKDVAKEMHTYYDALTDHGRNEVPAPQAVQMTISRFSAQPQE